MSGDCASMATDRTWTPRSRFSSLNRCQPGSCSLHPHQDAHMNRTTFLPRYSESLTKPPVSEGSSKSGAGTPATIGPTAIPAKVNSPLPRHLPHNSTAAGPIAPLPHSARKYRRAIIRP